LGSGSANDNGKSSSPIRVMYAKVICLLQQRAVAVESKGSNCQTNSSSFAQKIMRGSVIVNSMLKKVCKRWKKYENCKFGENFRKLYEYKETNTNEKGLI
jgi:hypothetical protein